MRFKGADEGWTSMRLTQIDAAQLLGGCPRTFRRKRRERTPWPGMWSPSLPRGCGIRTAVSISGLRGRMRQPLLAHARGWREG